MLDCKRPLHKVSLADQQSRSLLAALPDKFICRTP
jgi:hypothetical protein